MWKDMNLTCGEVLTALAMLTLLGIMVVCAILGAG